MHYLLKDTEFTKILKFLQQIKGIHKKDINQLKCFIEAICYVCRTGCQWRLLPIYYGNWRAIHKRFQEWSKRNIWQNLFENIKENPDMEWIMIDSTVVRAHACSAGYKKDSQEKEALGRSKGGFSTKIHAVVDALGNPLHFTLTAGQRHDITQAKELIQNVPNIPTIADTAYDADHFVNDLHDDSCIPPRKNRKVPRNYDKELYKERHSIECFFGKIKHFRRIFSRFDKSALSYSSFLHFVGVLIWLR